VKEWNLLASDANGKMQMVDPSLPGEWGEDKVNKNIMWMNVAIMPGRFTAALQGRSGGRIWDIAGRGSGKKMQRMKWASSWGPEMVLCLWGGTSHTPDWSESAQIVAVCDMYDRSQIRANDVGSDFISLCQQCSKSKSARDGKSDHQQQIDRRWQQIGIWSIHGMRGRLSTY
jgi:hypothetical protein